MTPRSVLLLYKKSAYSIYFERARSSFKKFAQLPAEVARFEDTHRRHFDCLKKVEDVLTRLKVPFKKDCRGRSIDYQRFDLVVTVGGDGTFLEAARSIGSQTILGVNSDPLWSVGRFCAADGDSFEKVFGSLLSGKAAIRDLSRINLHVRGADINVLNDVLVCHHNPAAMSRYYLSVNGIKEEQKSSGIWISTSAGSSGGIKSAGGRQLPAISDQLQYKPRELYIGRDKKGYKLRGGVLSANAKIEVTSLMREGSVFVDGSHVVFPFDFGESISIARSKEPLKAVWP